ncbi:helix-turn-helix domain-containing protein [Mycolicibacterium sp. 050158]|uniref:winged helix-turn-helix transcriptional regulator n=1 Tax=Mycolicibacterium sp. 050158 TaxID=3090602 RepID=UPI00299EC94D|nr:helix-turn-helix domain-containing protein [Mycolicibacterium sp. 050158]MDX1893046.1 helix-turn-helix domain-containing protein [Mycolicibacterium sp. 050158]
MSARRPGSRDEPHARRSECAIAGVLDIVGDRWSLLIVRDLWLRGRLRFQDFASMVGQESIPTNTLAARLRLLEEAGILNREKYQDHPERFAYELTSKGSALVPVLESMAQWGVAHIPHTRGFL